MSYSNFYSNACMLLGSLKRGVCHKHPFVTFPVSKVGLDLARILQNLGVIASYECFQNTKRVHKNHYKRWAPGDQQPTSTSEFLRVPHVYLKLNLSYDKFHPKHLAPGTSPLDFNRSFFAPTPEKVEVISSTRQKQFSSCREIISNRQNYGPGIFLVSSDIGLLTDIEAEHYNKGGVVLGFIGLPLSQVLQIRGMLLGKFAREHGTPSKQRTPLQSWPLSAAVRHELSQRVDGPLPIGKRGAELLSLEQQREGLTRDLDKIRKSDAMVVSQLEEHQELLQRQVVAWSRRSVLRQLIEEQEDDSSFHRWRGPRDSNRGGGGGGGRGGGGGGGGQAGGGRRRLQDF